MADLPEVTEDSFEAEVLNAKLPVLVEFTNDGCGICKVIAPALAHVAEEYADEVRVVIVDTDKSPGVAARYNVQSVPTIFMFVGGEAKERVGGNLSRGRLAQLVETHLGTV